MGNLNSDREQAILRFIAKKGEVHVKDVQKKFAGASLEGQELVYSSIGYLISRKKLVQKNGKLCLLTPKDSAKDG